MISILRLQFLLSFLLITVFGFVIKKANIPRKLNSEKSGLNVHIFLFTNSRLMFLK